MKPKDLETGLRNLSDFLVRKEIAIDVNPVDVRVMHPGRRITWKSPTPQLLTAGEFATVTNYVSIIEARQYSALLFDGAVLQMSFDFRHDDLIGHRLCFYPCPFELDPAEIKDTPLLDVIELYRFGVGEDAIRLRSPVRFDFDLKNAGEGHPAVHVHLIRQRCRCALVAPLSLGHFVRFVFYHFYPKVWKSYDYLRDYPQTFASRTISTSEELHLHFECRRPLKA